MQKVKKMAGFRSSLCRDAAADFLYNDDLSNIETNADLSLPAVYDTDNYEKVSININTYIYMDCPEQSKTIFTTREIIDKRQSHGLHVFLRSKDN